MGSARTFLAVHGCGDGRVSFAFYFFGLGNKARSWLFAPRSEEGELVPSVLRKECQFRLPRVCLRVISLHLPWEGVGHKHHLALSPQSCGRGLAQRTSWSLVGGLCQCSDAPLGKEKRITLSEKQKMPAGYVA